MALSTTNLHTRYIAGLGCWSDDGVTPCADGDRVYRWDDQSGNGNNLYQTTLANRPFFRLNRDGDPVVRFPYGLSDTNGSNPISCYMSASGAHITGTRAWTSLIVCKSYPHATANNVLLQLGTWVYGGLQFTAFSNYVPFLTVGNQAYASPRVHIPCSKVIIGGRCGASATDFIRSWKTTVSTGAVPSGDPGSGITVGATNTPNQYWYGDIHELDLWNAATSDVTLASDLSYLESTYNVPTSYDTQAACVGNSETLCTRTTDNRTWPFRGTPDTVLTWMCGVSGITIGADTSHGMRAIRANWIDDLYDASITNNICLIQLGINVTTTLGAGSDATDYGYLCSLCNEIKTAHAGWTIYCNTVPDRNDDGSYQTFATNFNARIRNVNTGTDHFDGYWDSGKGGDAPLGRLSDANNATYVYSDKVHPNNSGTFAIASAAWAKLTGSPLAPIFPTLDDVGPTQVSITFTDASSGETGFKLQRRLRTAGSSWSTVATGTSSPLTDTSATPSTSYYYRVVAYNGTADSTNDGVVAATTAADTTAPEVGLQGRYVDDVTAGLTTWGFSLDITDSESGVSTTSLQVSHGVVVTGPNGFSAYAVPQANADPDGSTSTRQRYLMTPPGGAWDYTANGTYTVSVAANKISDVAGNYVAQGDVSTFDVNLSAPSAGRSISGLGMGIGIGF